MKILVISYLYAPDQSPRAYRWSAIAEHWAAQGRQVEVVAGWKSGDLRQEVRNGVVVHRVGGIVEGLRSALGQTSQQTPQQGGSPQAAVAGAHLLPRLAKAAYRATVKQLFWPDYAFHWYPAARAKALALCATSRVDAVISVSHPFTAHLVGSAVKRRSPEQRWLVDIGDPFSLLREIPLNNPVLYGGLSRRAEGAVLRNADAVSVTVERCRADYRAAFPGVADKIAVIPPLLSLPEPGGGEASPLGAGTHLVCVGTLYRALRDPGPLLALFTALRHRHDDLHLHFYGSLNDCAARFEPYRDALGIFIHLHGMVPRAEIAAVMRSADILVNIGNATPHQLPSKLVEYVASARPILNLASGASDSTTPFLALHPAALTIRSTPGELPPESIDSVLAFVTAPPAIDPAAVQRFLAPHTIEHVAGAYEALLAAPRQRNEA